MRIKSLSIIALLLALTVGNTNAQNVVEQPQNLRDVELPLTQDFENGMQSWTLQNDPGNTGGGQISTKTNHTTNGQYSYYLSNSQKNRYLISPELTNTANGVNVNFWYTNYTTVVGDNSSLRIYYSFTTCDLSAFLENGYVSIETVSDDWQEYVGDFPAGVK